MAKRKHKKPVKKNKPKIVYGKYHVNVTGMTPNQREWAENTKRIEYAIRKLERQGYTFSEPQIPTKPKVIYKKDLAKIRAIKPRTLVKETNQVRYGAPMAKAKVVKPPKPKQVSIPEPEYEPIMDFNGIDITSASSEDYDAYNYEPEDLETESTAETLVLDRIELELERWRPFPIWNEWFTEKKVDDWRKANSMLTVAINNYGRQAVADNLERHAEEAVDCIIAVLYDSNQDSIHLNFSKFASILKGSALTMEEAIDMADAVYNAGY